MVLLSDSETMLRVVKSFGFEPKEPHIPLLPSVKSVYVVSQVDLIFTRYHESCQLHIEPV